MLAPFASSTTASAAGSSARFRPGRLGVALVTVALLAGSVAGCGSSKPQAAPASKVSTSSTPTPTPTPSSSPTRKPAPLSPFEKEAPVKAARQWAAAYARDVNAERPNLTSAQRYESAAGVTALPPIARTDLGYYFPGPLPFTPVDVKVAGEKAQVTICGWVEGFSLNRKTHRPAQKKQISPATFEMSRHRGRWLMDNAVAAQADCSGVKIKGVKW